MTLSEELTEDPGAFEYDVFISHATEDKDGLVRSLAGQLRNAGVRVWYDEFTLHVGDGLRASIDAGLRDSRYGIVVLSPAFFAKNWPRRELDGLIALETADGRSRILPIWLNVRQADVANFSPPLANLYALDGSREVDELVRELTSVILAYPHRTYRHFHELASVDVVAIARQEGGLIDGHSFKRCHLIGPAVLAWANDVALIGARLDPAQLWRLESGHPYVGHITLRNSIIEECTFDRVAFGLIPPRYEELLPGGVPDGYRPSTPGVSRFS